MACGLGFSIRCILLAGSAQGFPSAARSPFYIVVISTISTTLFESGHIFSLIIHVSTTLSTEGFCDLLISSTQDLQTGICTLVSAALRCVPRLADLGSICQPAHKVSNIVYQALERIDCHVQEVRIHPHPPCRRRISSTSCF